MTTIPAETLRQILRACAACSSGTINPALSNALVVAKPKYEFSARATDLLQWIEVSTEEAATTEEWSAMVPIESVLAIIRDIETNITLSSTPNTINIEFPGGGLFEIPRINDKMPTLDIRDSCEAIFQIPFDSLRQAVSSVSYAVAGEGTSSWKTIEGVIFEVNPEDKSLTLIGTDRNRVVVARVENITDMEGPNEIVAAVPVAFVKLLGVLPRHESDAVQVGICDRHITVETGLCHYRLSLIDGKFPNWRLSIPKNPPITVTTTYPKELASALRSIIAILPLGRSDVTIQTNDGVLEILSKTSSGKGSRLVRGVGNGKAEIQSNARHLLQHLSSQKSEEVSLEFHSERLIVTSPDGVLCILPKFS